VHTAPNVKWVGETQEHPSGYAPICIGTTTSARMERFTRPLMEQYGVRIVIGKGGARLKQVGTRARKEIEVIVGTPVYLDIHVKLAKDWQKDPKKLRRLGF
jgi:tartrate dehydratase beta subunit/fumarate hydratase class I family protein